MAAQVAAPPTIIVNKPSVPLSTTRLRSSTIVDPNGTTITTTSPTKDTPSEHQSQPVSLDTISTTSCYLCDEQNPGDFTPTTKFLSVCFLCSRPFCPIHKATSWDGVCNINHANHYHECLLKAAEELKAKGQADGLGDVKLMDVATQVIVEKGVFPSLGERDKMIWATSPVTEDKMREIAEFRSLDAQISGNDVRRKSELLEEKDFVGADIAV